MNRSAFANDEDIFALPLDTTVRRVLFVLTPFIRELEERIEHLEAENEFLSDQGQRIWAELVNEKPAFAPNDLTDLIANFEVIDHRTDPPTVYPPGEIPTRALQHHPV